MDSLADLVLYLQERRLNGGADLDYFDLIRRISLYSQKARPFGFSRDVNAENVRIKQNASLSYAQSEIEQISLDDKGRVQILENFFGLLGVSGPLPLAYSELFYKRAHNFKDKAALDFLNLLNHRFLALFTKAFFINEQACSFDFRKHDLILELFEALLGRAPSACGDKNYLVQSMSAFLNNRSRSAVGLKSVLNSYFKLPFEVSEFTQEKYLIPTEYRCRLGRKDNAILGHNLQLGSHFYSNTKKFSVMIRGIPFKTCRNFLPGQSKFLVLCRIINAYLKRPLEFDLVFILNRSQIPPLRLDRGSVLGICSYLPFYSKGSVALRVAASSFFNQIQSRAL